MSVTQLFPVFRSRFRAVLMTSADDDLPGSLRDPDVMERRKAMLTLPHVAPLTEFAKELRTRHAGIFIPDFDPLDGGIDAAILFLFEKPGRKTDAANGGSGFISRNNDDPTAKATFRFMNDAKIPRRDTAIWNVIPWWDGRRQFTGDELTKASTELDQLLQLFRRLHTVMLVGLTSAIARPHLQNLRVLNSPHPSPLVRARYPGRWNSIPACWAAAALPHKMPV